MPRPSTPTPAVPPAHAVSRFRRRLLRWFARHGRDLPWRRTRDPYRVLVSEFMLQQTQVSRVTEYYPRFLDRFGSIEALARARGSAVREAWEGLGYYARARNLHRLAKEVAGVGGRVPDDPAELIKLPGVGRYTAGAVACFAYEKPVAAVDTNVARVLRRVFFGERGAGSGRRRAGSKSRNGRTATAPRSVLPEIWQLAESIVPKNGETAWKFNQAVMELGATICVARRPRCAQCPVVRDCKTGRE